MEAMTMPISTNFFPANCIPKETVYSTGEGDEIVTCTFGTDCKLWYLIWGWTAEGQTHSARFATIPGEDLPDLRTARTEDGRIPDEVSGAFSYSVDGEPPKILVIRRGTVVERDKDSPVTDDRLASLSGPLQRLADSLPADISERAEALTSMDSPFTSCLSEAVTIGTGIGCGAGLVVGILSEGVALPKALGVGCGVGAAGGLVTGLIAC
jgi:hypothetical protein